MRKSARARGGAGAIHVHDQPGLSRAIAHLARGRERGAGKQDLEKEGTQSFKRGVIKGGKKAGEGRTVRQAMTTKQGQKRFCKGGEAFIKGKPGRFARNGVADQHDDKIDEVVLPKARTG